jgi:hypothetical protein
MTDLTQASLKPRSVKKIIIVLLVTVMLGSTAAFVVSRSANSEIVAILSIGRQDQSTFIEEPFAVIERLKSSWFAAAASTRAGIPQLSTLLPARQYGGSGALSARSLRDLSLVEIRIDLPQPDLAQKAMTAVVDELIANHEAKIAPLIQYLQSSIPTLDRRTSEMIKASDAITNRLKGSSLEGEIDQEKAALLSARALNEAGLSALVKSASDLRLVLTNIRKTQLVTTPLVTMKATSFYRTLAAGALGGLLIGLLLPQMFPSLFLIGRRRSEINQPDAAQT